MPQAPAKPEMSEVQALGLPTLLERYVVGANRFERRVLDLSDEQQDTCFRPEAGVGRWSCRMLVGHVADADLVYTHRMRRAVAEDFPLMPGWDEQAFVDSGLYAGEKGGADRPIAGSVALVHTLRLWTADWLRTLTDAQWSRRMLHQERGEMTVREVCAFAVWHVEHHAWFLSRKLERLIGPADAT